MQSTEIQIVAMALAEKSGQRVHWLRLEYPVLIAAKSLKTDTFSVKGEKVTNVFVNTSGKPHETSDFGRYVFLELDQATGNTKTYEHLHDVPHGRMVMRDVIAELKQVRPIMTALGSEIPTWEDTRKCRCVLDPTTDAFRQFAWKDPVSGNTMQYNLFIPTNLSGQKLPLVLFIHDAGACSEDIAAGLAQGLGGTVWTYNKSQAERPCFVLVPQYSRPIVEDDWSETWEVEATLRLVEYLTQAWAIDSHRLYATGQSMGCMTLCALNAQHPDFFAASLLVAGQWNPDVTGALKDCHLWVLVSEQDEKAFPGMKAVAQSIEAAGGKVAYTKLNATDPMDVQNAVVRNYEGEKYPIVFSYFEGDSVIQAQPAGGHPHPKTWCCAYQVNELQNWLFQWEN